MTEGTMVMEIWLVEKREEVEEEQRQLQSVMRVFHANA